MTGLTFTTLPVRSLADDRLSAMDLRTLGAIALHDRRSLARHGGAGCWASNPTLAGHLGCSERSLLRSVSRLLAWGYLVREEAAPGKSGRVLRIIEGGDEIVTPDELVTPHSPDEIVTPPLTNSSSNPCRIRHPKRTRIEPRKDSAEAAHFADRETRPESDHPSNVLRFPDRDAQAEPSQGLGRGRDEAVDRDQLQTIVQDAIASSGTARALSNSIGIPEGQLSKIRTGRNFGPGRLSDDTCIAIKDAIFRHFGPDETDRRERHDRREVSFTAQLPRNFANLDATAQVPAIERTLRKADFAAAPDVERSEIISLLYSITDVHEGSPTGEQAQRLYSELCDVEYEREHGT